MKTTSETISKVNGNFAENQPIMVIDNKGLEIARGISLLSSENIETLIQKPIAKAPSPMVIHRDALVLTSEIHS